MTSRQRYRGRRIEGRFERRGSWGELVMSLGMKRHQQRLTRDTI